MCVCIPYMPEVKDEKMLGGVRKKKKYSRINGHSHTVFREKQIIFRDSKNQNRKSIHCTWFRQNKEKIVSPIDLDVSRVNMNAIWGHGYGIAILVIFS